MPTQLSSSTSRLENLRHELDAQGFFQLFVPECRSLVEAMLHRIKTLQSKENASSQTEETAVKGIRDATHSRHLGASRTRDDRVDRDEVVHHEGASYKAKYEEERREKEAAKRALAKAKSCIEAMKHEASERTNIINQLVNRQGAKVVVDDEDSSVGAKLTISKPLKEQEHHSSKNSNEVIGNETRKRESLEVSKVYETKIKQLQRENHRLKTQLQQAQNMLKRVQNELNKQEDKSGEARNAEKSDYVLKLIGENEDLRRRLTQLEDQHLVSSSSSASNNYISSADTPKSVDSKPKRKGKKVQWRSCEDISVSYDDEEWQQRRHFEDHEPCSRRQMLKARNSFGTHRHFHVTSTTGGPNGSSLENDNYIAELESRIDKLYSRLDQNEKDKYELEMRVEELRSIRDNLEERNEELKERIQVLSQKDRPQYENLEEVVKLVERQRDVYKRSVERLLSKLDPKLRQNLPLFSSPPDRNSRRSNGKSSERDEMDCQEVRNGDITTEDALQSALENSRRVLQETYNEEYYTSKRGTERDATINGSARHSYHANESLVEQLETDNRRAQERIAELVIENQQLRKQLRAMEITLEDLQSAQPQNISALAAAHSSSILALEDRIADQERELKELRGSRGSLRERLQIAEDGRKADKVVFQEQIKLKTREFDEMRKKLLAAESKLGELESRKTAEKQLGVQMRQEIATLKEQLKQKDLEMATMRSSEKQLQATVQRYVSEVKRVEEVLELKEREWLELLDQYKHLADEADSAESNGKNLQDTVGSLERELALSKSALEASERQVFELEQDLMQVTAANESMRITIGDLSQRVEVAEGDLKEAQEESYSVHSDLTNVHQLAIQLNSQKVELQQQIASQALAMEKMRIELEKLRADHRALKIECDKK